MTTGFRRAGSRAPIAVLAAALLGLDVHPAAQSSEHEVKAAFLYNFARFVEWPSAASADLHLCVVGTDSFGAALGQIDGKSVGARRLAIARLGARDDVSGCQMLFVTAPAAADLPRILQTVSAAPVLTVADTDGAAMRGVMINFYLDAGRVRFEINVDAAKRAKLTISSYLLRLARLVGDTGPPA